MTRESRNNVIYCTIHNCKLAREKKIAMHASTEAALVAVNGERVFFISTQDRAFGGDCALTQYTSCCACAESALADASVAASLHLYSSACRRSASVLLSAC